MGLESLHALTTAIRAKEPDHIVVSGDLTNLALPAEFDQTRVWLSQLGSAASVSVIPGNHDAYVRGALAEGFISWAPWVTGDNGKPARSNDDFPFARVRKQVQIIGCSSAVATPPFVAAGHFGEKQADRLSRMLQIGGQEGLFRIVMIHHPPVRHATLTRKRLYGIARFQSVIAKHGAELILHGHTHLPQRHFIDGPSGQVPVLGVPAASETPGHNKPPGAFNLFEIGRNSTGTYTCTHEEWSVDATQSVVVTERNLLY